jgi:hypothetical protein
MPHIARSHGGAHMACSVRLATIVAAVSWAASASGARIDSDRRRGLAQAMQSGRNRGIGHRRAL